MDSNLATSLVNKGVLVTGTEIEAHYRAAGLGGVGTVVAKGEFTIDSVGKTTEGDMIFVATSTRDGRKQRILAEAVTSIDGMDPSRFAAVYNIKADGSGAKMGKRRGRKPKDRSGANGGNSTLQRDGTPKEAA
jgi:hypothetical protein